MKTLLGSRIGLNMNKKQNSQVEPLKMMKNYLSVIGVLIYILMWINYSSSIFDYSQKLFLWTEDKVGVIILYLPYLATKELFIKTNAKECTSLFLDESIIDLTTKYTNNIKNNYSREIDAKETNIMEIKWYIWILLIAGVLKLSRMSKSQIFEHVKTQEAMQYTWQYLSKGSSFWSERCDLLISETVKLVRILITRLQFAIFLI